MIIRFCNVIRRSVFCADVVCVFVMSCRFAECLTGRERGLTRQYRLVFNESMEDGDCMFCGACVSACPTGSATDNSKRKVAPEYKVKTTCPFCGVGCSFDLQVKEDRVVGMSSNLTAVVNGVFIVCEGAFRFGLYTLSGSLDAAAYSQGWYAYGGELGMRRLIWLPRGSRHNGGVWCGFICDAQLGALHE